MKASLGGRRAAVGFLILGLVGAALFITPAGAHVTTVKHSWKGHFLPLAKKTFFTKSQVNAMMPRLTGSARDWPETSPQSIPGNTAAPVLQQTVTAPSAGILLANYSAWVESGSEIFGTMWLEIDQGTPCTGTFSSAPDVPGTTSFSSLGGTRGTEDTNAGTAAIPVTKGSHSLVLCGRAEGSGFLSIPDASMTALFVKAGSNSMVTSANTRSTRGLATSNR